MCTISLSEFVNFYLTDDPIYVEEKSYLERKQELKENILNFLEGGIIKLNLRRFYNPINLKENWLEIRNVNVFKEALLQIFKFIDNPTYKNLELVKWFANEFDYSKKIVYYKRIYNIFHPLREKDNLGKAITPMIKEILKGYDNYYEFSDSDSD